jgi:hypothetical protein
MGAAGGCKQRMVEHMDSRRRNALAAKAGTSCEEATAGLPTLWAAMPRLRGVEKRFKTVRLLQMS